MVYLRNYRDLIVWQKSMDLAGLLYKRTAGFPKEEIYGLTSQMRRASISVAANIAEGHSRNSLGEYKQFLGIARGSIAELETLLILSGQVNILNESEQSRLLDYAEEIHKMLHGLIRSLK